MTLMCSGWWNSFLFSLNKECGLSLPSMEERSIIPFFFAVSMDTNTAESDISSSHCPDRLHGMCPRQNETPKIHLWDLHMITSLCLQPYVLRALISLWERDSGRESLRGNHLLSRKPSWNEHAGVGFYKWKWDPFSDSTPGLVSCADRAVCCWSFLSSRLPL